MNDAAVQLYQSEGKPQATLELPFIELELIEGGLGWGGQSGRVVKATDCLTMVISLNHLRPQLSSTTCINYSQHR